MAVSTSISRPFRPSRQTSAATSWVISDTWSSSRTCSRMQFLARKRNKGGPADQLLRSPLPKVKGTLTHPPPPAQVHVPFHRTVLDPCPLFATPHHSPKAKDSPSDARPCTPQPAPPTPRARRCGQQRPIICRQRLLKRVGCWLENKERKASGNSGSLPHVCLLWDPSRPQPSAPLPTTQLVQSESRGHLSLFPHGPAPTPCRFCLTANLTMPASLIPSRPSSLRATSARPQGCGGDSTLPAGPVWP